MSKRVTGPEAIRAAREAWRRGQIVEAATRLMQSHGFHEMSVAALAEEADMSVGTIYQYVQRKEDILLLVILDILAAYREEIPAAMEGIEDPIERLAAGFQSYCDIVDRHRSGTVLAYRESKTLDAAGLRQIMELELETTGLLAECVRDGAAAGIVTEVDPDVVSYDLTMFAHMWALKHWHLGHMSLDDYVSTQLAIMLRTLVKPELHDAYRELLRGPGATVNGRRKRDAASPRRRAETP